MADNAQQQNPSVDDSYGTLMAQIEAARKRRQTDNFGKPLPELSSADITPVTSPVQFHQTPGGGSLPWTSVITGANNAEFPIAAWYKSKQAGQAYKQSKITNYNKATEEPYGTPEFQPNVDKFWNNNVVSRGDELLQKYGNRWYDIYDGEGRTAQERKDADEFKTRIQTADTLAAMNTQLGKGYDSLNKLKETGAYVPLGVLDQYHALAQIAPDLHNMDDSAYKPYMQLMRKMTALPSYYKTVQELGKDPQMTTAIENAYKTVDGKQVPISDTLELTKYTMASVPQLQNWTDNMYAQGYLSPLDPNQDNTDNSPESVAAHKNYIAQDFVNQTKQTVEKNLHNERQDKIIINNGGDESKTAFTTAPSTITFNENGKDFQQSTQSYTTIKPLSIGFGSTYDALNNGGFSKSTTIGKDATATGIVMLNVAPQSGGRVLVVSDDVTAQGENKKLNAFHVPFVKIEVPKKEYDKDGKVIPSDTKEYETMYLPLSEAAGDLQNTVSKEDKDAMKSTIDQYLKLADEFNGAYASDKARDYYSSHYEPTSLKAKKQNKKGHRY